MFARFFIKVSLQLLLAAVILGGALYVGFPHLVQYLVLQLKLSDPVRTVVIPAALGLFFAITFCLLYAQLHRPFRTVLREMRALLAGRPYRKIFTSRVDEVGVLAYFFNAVTKNIEKISLDLAEGKRMSKELNVGSDIQQRVLPKEIPHINGISVFGRTRPASEMGGDSFDIIAHGNNTFIYTGDVTGHGVPAALIMMMVNILIRTFAELYDNGYDIIVNTNRLLKSRIEPRRFMTAVMLRWNAIEKKLFFTGAGHEHIIWYHAKDRRSEALKSGGIALGMVPDISKIVKEQHIAIEPDDVIVLYSDGIGEAKNMTGEMFGLERLKSAVQMYGANAAPEELFTKISSTFGQFVGDQTQEDDITLIVMKRVADD